MRRAPREIVREAVAWNSTFNADMVADVVMRRLGEEGWHLVSVPVVTVLPVEEPRGYAEGLEEVRGEGFVDRGLVKSTTKLSARRRLLSAAPDAYVASATANAAREYLRGLGQCLGLPL